MTHTRKIAALFVWAALSLGLAQPALAQKGQAQGPNPQQVANAIDKAVDYLYKQQNKNGTWEPAKVGHQQDGGDTALVVYALLSAGESYQDPRLKRAINYLANVKMEGVYAIAMRTQVWHLMRKKGGDIRRLAKRDADSLLKAAQIPKAGGQLGLYRYTLATTSADNSCSQIAVLGMWACADELVEVPRKYWDVVGETWRRNQLADGGWSYGIPKRNPNNRNQPPQGKSTLAMTAAGVATLFITEDFLAKGKPAGCAGNKQDKNIEAGLKWIGDLLSKGGGGGRNSAYAWYGVERIGVASGRKYFGTVDWYKIGANRFLRAQRGDGGMGNVRDTCFGILFLVRGSAPVVMNKLMYEIDVRGDTPKLAHWNQRPRDAANVVSWLAKQTERNLNWQIVNLDVKVEELHDAPILYIAGNQRVTLKPEHQAKIKQFVEQGGTVLVNVDCNQRAFTAAMQKLATDLWPMYEFRNLPFDHPIYTRQQFNVNTWRRRVPLQSMGNGAREFFIIMSNDPARAWQSQTFSRREEDFFFVSNLFLYATDKADLRSKGVTHIVSRNKGVQTRHNIKIGRIEYKGNWNPEPGGWKRLAAVMHNENGVKLEVSKVDLGKDKLNDYKVLHLTGTAQFQLPKDQADKLQKWVAAGGTLIVDAAGGSSDFAASAEKLLREHIVPGKPMARLHAGADEYGIMRQREEARKGTKTPFSLYRNYARMKVVDTRSPSVAGIKLDDRAAVYFSPQDLSVGLVGNEVDGIYGYSPEAATAIMQGFLLKSAKLPVKAPKDVAMGKKRR